MSKTGSVEPSPKPHTSRSAPVGISLRCLPSSVPSGAKNSAVQYSVPPPRSITPITRWQPRSRAIAPSRSVAGPGTSIEDSQ